MEISRRHLQETERAELRDVLIIGGESGFGERITEILHADCRLAELAEHALPDAAEMQRQVDGLTRNQRRVLNKRMRNDWYWAVFCLGLLVLPGPAGSANQPLWRSILPWVVN